MATDRDNNEVDLKEKIYEFLQTVANPGSARFRTGEGIVYWLRRRLGFIFENLEFDEAMNQLVAERRLRMQGVATIAPTFIVAPPPPAPRNPDGRADST